MGLTTEQQMLIEQRVTNDGPSAGTAWLLLLFLGLLGAHRFYLGRAGSGVLMILATLCFIFPGALWAFVDLFLLSGMIRARRDEIRRRLQHDMMAMAAAQAPAAVTHAA